MEEHFAALRIPDSDHDIKLTRAFSFSELPTARRICLEQHYQSGVSPGLVKQYSCEQIFDKVSNIRQVKISEVVKAGDKEQKKTWKTMIPPNDGFKVPDWPPRMINNLIQPPKLVPDEVEYMDVDDIQPINRSLSCSPTLKSDARKPSPTLIKSQSSKNISTLDSNIKQCSSNDQEDKTDYQALKKKLRPLVPGTTKTNQMGIIHYSKVLFFILVPIAFVTVGVVLSPESFGLFTQCDDTATFCNAREELREQVFGQKNAILALSTLLINDQSKIKILCLIGGTGVGKSYTAGIIKRNFPFQHNIYEYYPPLSDKLDIDSLILSQVTCNLLIIDNLKSNHIENVARFLSPLKDLKEYCVIAVTIFNVEHTNDNLERQINLPQSTKDIQGTFGNYELLPAVIQFEPLNEKALEQCILAAAQTSQLILSYEQVSRVKNSLISTNSGCKGAYSKTQIVGRQ